MVAAATKPRVPVVISAVNFPKVPAAASRTAFIASRSGSAVAGLAKARPARTQKIAALGDIVYAPTSPRQTAKPESGRPSIPCGGEQAAQDDLRPCRQDMKA